MRDYWLTQYLLAAVGWTYIILASVVLGLALWIPKGKLAKLVAGVIVLALVSILPMRGYQGYLQEKQAAQEFSQRQAKARALFEERCRTAGEKIYKTVAVDGIAIERLRPERINLGEQYLLDDPYGQVSMGGTAYLNSFLSGRKDANWLTDEHTVGAYQFVDLLNPPGGATRYRVLFVATSDGHRKRQLVSEPTQHPVPYVIRWSDISTQEDRKHWIACGKVEVLDQTTRRVLGERSGCMFDPALGSKEGGRSPWAFARDTACPEPRLSPDRRAYHDPQDRNFVEKVLKPSGGG